MDLSPASPLDLVEADVAMTCDPLTAADVRASAASARDHGRDELADSLDELYGAMLADEHRDERRILTATCALGFALGFLTGPWSLLPVA